MLQERRVTTLSLSQWNADPLPLAKLLRLELVAITPDRVEAVLQVREELCTRPAVLHGGAVMALADTLGGIATIANLAEGTTTTTIESKTNFFAAIPVGDTATAECTPLHRGRTTMVWQTKVMRSDGRVAALVIQTQLVMPATREPSTGTDSA
jgi:1,4-dihydroxy-2-naphthoyl-CoA hydrolase